MLGYIKLANEAEWIVIDDRNHYWTPDRDEATEVTELQFEYFEQRYPDTPLSFDQN